MCFCLRRDTTMHWATIGGESKSTYSKVGLPMQSVVSQLHLTRCIPSVKYSMNWINTESQTHILKMPRLCLPKTRHFWTILVQFWIRSTFWGNCYTTEVSQMNWAYCICLYWGKGHNWFYVWSSPITLYGMCGSMTVFIRHIWVSDLYSEASPMRHTCNHCTGALSTHFPLSEWGPHCTCKLCIELQHYLIPQALPIN